MEADDRLYAIGLQFGSDIENGSVLRFSAIGYNETSKALTAWKQEEILAFLKEVSSVPLQQCLRSLRFAFANFFEGLAGYPNFNSSVGI